MQYEIKIRKVENSRLNELDYDNIKFGKLCSDHMFISDFDGEKWGNHRIVPTENISIHPALMALHYGQSIFEGMKASKDGDGNPFLFRPEMHAKRINNSARRMNMPEIPEDLFLESLHTLVGLDVEWIPPQKGSAMYIRPFMFATDSFIGVRSSITYSFIILLLPAGPYYERPISLKVEREFIRASKGGVGEAKAAGNYGAAMLPEKLAKKAGFDQVIWLDGQNKKLIQEVGTMNIFFVLKDKIITPATTGAILKGITRNSIITLMKEKGYTVEERDIEIDYIKEMYEKGELIEIFGSGTAALIAHVNRVGDGDYEMLFDESKWTTSKMIKAEINGIRARTIGDKFGWLVPVKVPNLV